MKKTILLLIFLSAAAKAQFLQFGGQLNFLSKQTVQFNEPIVLDSAFLYDEKLFVLEKNLLKVTNTHIPALDFYLNYRFSQSTYVGLNFKYSHQLSNFTGDYYDGPDIRIKSPALGIMGGYTKKGKSLSYFAEAGFAVTRLKFEFDWRLTASGQKYERYLNQKNSFLLGFGKIGVRYSGITLSTRMDMRLADIKNPSAIKKITYRPTINLGMDFRSAFVGKKRLRIKEVYTQLDEDAELKQQMEFYKAEYELGIGTVTSIFELKESGMLSHSPTSQIQLTDKWNSTSMGLCGNLKYAPFAKKRFVIACLFHYAGIGYKAKIGTHTSGKINSAGNTIINGEKKDLIFSTSVTQLGFSAGYRFKVSSLSFIDASPVLNFMFISQGSNMSSEIGNYFNWKSTPSTAVGVNITYKRNHWGLSLKMSQGLSDMEKNNRFKNGQFYSIILLRDVRTSN